MDTISKGCGPCSRGADIIFQAESVGLDPKILYEAVVDLSSEGLLTATCINMAAGILLQDLGLPKYFFQHIQKDQLINILQAIAVSMKIEDGDVMLTSRVAPVDFNTAASGVIQKVRIATEETRDTMEALLEELLTGHRREYYYSPASRYYTYIILPETVADFTREDFVTSRFLFSLVGDDAGTLEPTKRRYEKFLLQCEQSTTPLIGVFNLPETGETRLMFNSDFEASQLPVLRKILADHGLVLVRAYWEPYLGKSTVPSSICTLYVSGELTRKQEDGIVQDLQAYLAFAISPVKGLYLEGQLSFAEMLFAGNVMDFTHLFVYKETENTSDRDILDHLTSKDQQEAFARRIQTSNKSTYGFPVIWDAVQKNPDLIAFLYVVFRGRFFPGKTFTRLDTDEVARRKQEFERIISSRFIDYPIGYEIFSFMFKLIECTLKTNFYKGEKRSFAFRFDNRVLDPLVFPQQVFGIFFVNGHYSCGTHLRAADIARGGLRLIRVSPSNYDAELDNAVLLNYALGPKAQRLKHKDICESGSKGVVIPQPAYALYQVEALNDYTEGIMDLVLPDEEITDYYGRQEMIFFGPDEGTAPLMDAVAEHAREKGYRYWRTITTGKSSGIPHDTFGLLQDGRTFGLFGRGARGTELQIDGASVLTATDSSQLYGQIGGNIQLSGMTTSSIMSSFRTLIEYHGVAENSLNLMMTGGPDGDLGANQIQCYQGKICLLLDGGSVLFDPHGLDRQELNRLAMARHTSPRLNSKAFDLTKLSSDGFFVPIDGKDIKLPDGRFIEDGALFHKTFLVNPENRSLIEQAAIRAFIPCGGFKDTVNAGNVVRFTRLFAELEFIVEGANVFFDDAARRYIAAETGIRQIKDSTANKGGVFSSSISEVLTAFLLQDDYEHKLVEDAERRWTLISEVLRLVERYARLETKLLLELHEKAPATPLFELSEKTSELIFALEEELQLHLESILADEELTWKVLESYIPAILVTTLGRDKIRKILDELEMIPYRNAIVTKKLASMAFYRYGADWENYLAKLGREPVPALRSIFV